MNRRITTFAYSLAACLVSFASVANEVRYFSEDQIPTVAEIASLLAAPAATMDAPARLGGRTRAIRMMDVQASPHQIEPQAQVRSRAPTDEPRVREPIPTQVAKVPSVGTVALALRFSFDATQVHPQHRAQLDALAEGIKQLPENALVTIAGHTDAFGSPAYNIDLSLKRAFAVRAYLVRAHGIPAKRLVAMGKGKSEPFNRTNPYAPENRRVQVHAEYDVAQSGAVLLSGSGS